MDCSKCIFAEFSPPSSGGLLGVFQTGCSANRLETLKKLNKAKYSEDKSCYEINFVIYIEPMNGKINMKTLQSLWRKKKFNRLLELLFTTH